MKGEGEVKDLRGHRWCSHQEGRLELERIHEPISQRKVQHRWQVGSQVHRERRQFSLKACQRLSPSKIRRFEKWFECSMTPQGPECRASEASLDKAVWRAVYTGLEVPLGVGVTGR